MRPADAFATALVAAALLAPVVGAMEPDRSFDTGTLSTNATGAWTAGAPGTYTYICTIHPSMEGTLNVTRASGSGQSFAVDIQSFAFRPGALEVPSGAQVVWTNRDGAPHTATSTGFTPAPEEPDGMADGGAGNDSMMHNDTVPANDTKMDDGAMMGNDSMMKNDTMEKDDAMMGNGTMDQDGMAEDDATKRDAMADARPSGSAATPGPALLLVLAAAGLAAAMVRRRT